MMWRHLRECLRKDWKNLRNERFSFCERSGLLSEHELPCESYACGLQVQCAFFQMKLWRSENESHDVDDVDPSLLDKYKSRHQGLVVPLVAGHQKDHLVLALDNSSISKAIKKAQHRLNFFSYCHP
jgi:hypothetical protein